MKLRKNFFDNFSNVNGGSVDIQRDILLDEIAEIMRNHKPLLLEALSRGGVKVNPKVGAKKLVSIVVEQMYVNDQFRQDMVMMIIALNAGELNEEFYSFNKDKFKSFFSKIGSSVGSIFSKGGGEGGDAAQTVASSTAAGSTGGVVGAVVGLVGGVTQSVFNYKASKEQAAAQKEASKTALYDKLLGGDKKTNWMPIIIVGGVFLVGAIVLMTTLKRK